MATKLTRSSNDRILGGVCSGIAEYFGLDTSVVRIGFLLACIIGGGGLWAYLIAWFIIPNADGDSGFRSVRETWKSTKGQSSSSTFDPYRD